MTTKRHDIQFRMRIYRDSAIAIGPGRIALLEAIDRTGSISAAARELKMSYRRAWSLVNETNLVLKKPAVISSEGGVSGGGSQLTDTGRTLINNYRDIEAIAADAAKSQIQTLIDLISDK